MIRRWRSTAAPTGSSGIGRSSATCRGFIDEDTVVVFEVGFDQAASVAALLDAQGFKIERVARDIGGHERVVAARLYPSRP